MRKNGTAILQSFLEDQSLLAPQYLSSLRALVEHRQSDGVIATAIRAMGLGGGMSRQREDATITHDSLCMTMGLGQADRSKPFAFSDGVAVIPVHGALLHRDDYSDEYATGYDFIRSRYQAAMADPDVTHIVFDVNSGGGHVAGNFELCDEIVAGRSRKPSLAMVDASGYSGAYSLSSAASRIAVMPSGGVGSIGVLMMHVSVEKFLEKNGIDVNLIYAGARKIDSYPFNELSEPARARFQAGVDKSYEKFVSLVARNRNMDAKVVRDTEAMTYDAEEALSLGLVDEINTPALALAAFRLGPKIGPNTNPQQGAHNMANEIATGGGGNASAADTTNTQAAPAAAAVVAPAAAAVVAPAAVVAAPAAVATDPALAERARIKGITSCEEAKGREDLAAHLAHETSMSVDDARVTLSKSPMEAKRKDGSPFAAAMANGNPEVGAGGGSGEGSEATVSVGDRIASNYAAVTGVKLRDIK